MRLFKKEGRFLLLGLILVVWAGQVRAQTASFNFSATSSVWPGWVNVAGDPSQAVQTATGNGVTLSSVATANWSPWSGIAAGTGTGFYPGTYFPARVMSNNWFTYNGTSRSLALYNVLTPQIELSGLNPDSTYILQISGSDAGSFIANPTQYTVIGKTNYGTQNLNAHNNAANGVVFQGVTPDSSGMVRLYVNATTSTDIAVISGIQIYPGYYGVGSPGVVINGPGNGAQLAEGNNIAIKALAVEVSNTIAKVEFYADTTKIGEVDAAPYNFTWVDPDPGVYTFTAKATDNLGTVGSASVSVDVVPLNDYWSTTGNIGNNADSTFLGNVDSARMDFRTKNVQRMSITATGNVGIGVVSPTTRLQVNGSVRLAGLAKDSAGVYPRGLVIDSSGNIAYRSSAALEPPVGAGIGLTASGAMALGDSIAGAGPHSFTVNRYQNLNSYFYSIGGKVNNPVTRPDFRWYNNGDFVSGTTMDHSVNTVDSPGIRYYGKLGVFQIGASDWLDTMRSPIITGGWQGSGLHLNSGLANSGGPKMINSLYLGFGSTIDTSLLLTNSVLAEQGLSISSAGSFSNSVFAGGYTVLSAAITNSVVVSYQSIDLATISSFLSANGLQQDTVKYSTITGFEPSFGGLGQLVAGAYVWDRTPFGTALGVGGVNFSTLPFTHTKGVTVSGIAGYPLLALGNSAIVSNTQTTNALTVLYNGRTQINTAGFGTGLTQTAATPKAALEVVSTNTGVLFPKMTTGQRNAIASGDLQSGLLFFNIDSGGFQYFNGSVWNGIAQNNGGAIGWKSLGNSGSNPASNFIGNIDSEAVVFRTDDTARMTVLANGSVGIGTSTIPASDARLAVDGSLYSTKVTVTLAGWPDYVFEKGYPLPSLPSIGRYVRRYRHLPGMPSSADVMVDGVDLGDNQAALLKKVEELTLYLIEEHKRSMARQEEIAQLKAQQKDLDDHQQEIDRLRETLERLLTKNENELHK